MVARERQGPRAHNMASPGGVTLPLSIGCHVVLFVYMQGAIYAQRLG